MFAGQDTTTNAISLAYVTYTHSKYRSSNRIFYRIFMGFNPTFSKVTSKLEIGSYA